jgi:hypothetical protein
MQRRDNEQYERENQLLEAFLLKVMPAAQSTLTHAEVLHFYIQ